MSSKKRRQTMDKLRREQTVKKRRADKLQKKEDARIARAAGALAGEASLEPVSVDDGQVATTEVPKPVRAATVERN
jgi:hypothetical protein